MASNRLKTARTARKVAFMGLLFGLAMVLSVVESVLLPTLPAGIKLGLSNVVTMYCLFFIGKGPAVTLAVLKSFFVFITRGAVAALLSAAGGVLSVLIMMLLLSLPGKPVSVLLISVAGAVGHNIGQLCIAQFVVGTSRIFTFFPILVISGVIMGTATGILCKTISPYMNRLGLSLERQG